MALTKTERDTLCSAIKTTLTKLGPLTVDQIRTHIHDHWSVIPESHLHHGTIHSVLKNGPIFEEPGFKVAGKAVWRLKPKRRPAETPEKKPAAPAVPTPPTVKVSDQKLFEKVMLALVASGQPDVKRAQEIVAAIRKAEGVKGEQYFYDPIMSLHMSLRSYKAASGVPAHLEFKTPDGLTFLFDAEDVKAELGKLK